MRLFIADGNSSNRLALQMYLQQQPGMYVIGMAAEVQGLLAQLEASRAEVMLLSWRLPGAIMPDLLGDVQALEHSPKVVVLAADPDAETPALSAGAEAFFNMNAPNSQLLEILLLLNESTVNRIN
jgi:DNA-binding NarL/FixJ family response regulator